jgi:AcrR family transcriptional regulator
MEVSARGRPRSSDLDRRILAAARDALAAGGYEALSMEAVARAAGVGKQTLYRRWPRRPLLVMDAVLPGVPPGVSPGRGQPDTGSLAGDLAAIVAEQTRADQAVGQRLLRGLVADCLGQEDLTEVLRARLLRPRLRAVGVAAERAARRGELAADVPPALVAEAVAGAMLSRLLLLDTRRDELAFGRRLARLVAHGACLPAGNRAARPPEG